MDVFRTFLGNVENFKNQEACLFWLNICSSSFFLFFLAGEKRKKDKLVQKFNQKEQGTIPKGI